MGAVYVVEQLSTRAQRALKLMHPELVRDASLRARFEQEAKISSQIPSDHVVQVIAAGVDDATGMPWLAMELLDGTDLLEAAATGRAGPAVLREIMAQLCHALGAAHERGIVHRDLKPENIFLAAPRRAGIPFTVKVLDFGISKLTSQAHSASATASLGTPLWMAPEQAGASSGQISPATDVWAMGLIAFWLLTGRHYWLGARDENTTLQAIMREVLFDPIAPASERAAQISSDARLPTGFDAWFAKTVQRDPAQRFANATLAGQELEKALAPADQPEPVQAAKAAVAHTVDVMPPLRVNTPPAPPPPVPAPQVVHVPQARQELGHSRAPASGIAGAPHSGASLSVALRGTWLRADHRRPLGKHPRSSLCASGGRSNRVQTGMGMLRLVRCRDDWRARTYRRRLLHAGCLGADPSRLLGRGAGPRCLRLPHHQLHLRSPVRRARVEAASAVSRSSMKRVHLGCGSRNEVVLRWFHPTLEKSPVA